MERVLQNLAGVQTAQVNFAAEKAYVEFDPAVTSRSVIETAIIEAGYGVRAEAAKVILAVEGMHCAACASKVEKNLRQAAGVETATVNLAAKRAYVDYNPTLLDAEGIARIVTNSGYKAVIAQETKHELDAEIDQVQRAAQKMKWAWAFTVPIMLWMLPG